MRLWAKMNRPINMDENSLLEMNVLLVGGRGVPAGKERIERCAFLLFECMRFSRFSFLIFCDTRDENADT